MLHTLKLKNFKQHKDLEVVFTDGLNVIAGDNGAGKSTVLKAILYALFGASAAGTKQHLSTWGSDETMEVRLTMTLNGTHLSMLRSFDKSVIYADDELVASGNTPCTKYLEQELGLEYKTFKHLLYAGQGETQSLLKLGAADLQRKIEIITKIDGIDKVVALIADDLQNLNGKLSVVPQVSDVSVLAELLNELNKAEADKTLSIIEGENMHDQIKQELAGKLNHLTNEITPALVRARETKSAEAAITTSLNRVKSDLDAHTLGYMNAPARLVKADLEDVSAYIEAKYLLVSKGSAAERQLSKAMAVYETAKDAVTALVKDKPLFTHYQGLVARLRVTEEASVSLDRIYQELLQIKLDCPECNRPFDTEGLSVVRHRLEDAKYAAEEAKTFFMQAAQAVSKFEGQHHQIVRIDYEASLAKATEECELANTQACKASLNEDILSKEELDDYSGMIMAAESDQMDLTKALAAAVAWESKRELLVAQLARLTQDLSALSCEDCEWTDEDLTEAESDVKLLQVQLQAQYDALVEARYNLKETTAEKLRCKKELEIQKAADELRKELEEERAVRRDLQTYLRTNRARLLSETWDSITNLTSAYTSDITDGLIHSLSRDSAGSFFIQEGEHNVPVDELSGGRQSIVGLALRMALGQTFYGANSFILLDEISSDLTDHNAAAVAGMLQGLDTQTIMVSHRQGDLSNATHVIIL